ncbi:DUF167 family protein YggU [Vibrio gangliei]|uniref:DUF167 family protein YggU n=1 Tax=Vibrio gangliei TaxID=2077090 RepID=UPI000D01DEF9|nr:DUF167 family protein YggU [Vibrio gangliei]
MNHLIQRAGDDLLLRVYIQPKASRDAIIGQHGDELKIAITAPPIDGKANAYLSKYLAKQFKVAKGNVNIEKGELGRHKTIRIISPTQIPAEVEALLSNNERINQ